MEKIYISQNCEVHIKEDIVNVKVSFITGQFNLHHIEWVELDESNLDKKMIFKIIADGMTYSIVVFEYQYNIFRELYNYLFPYTRRIVIDKKNNHLLIYNKLNEIHPNTFHRINNTIPITKIDLNKIKECKVFYNKINTKLDIKDIAVADYVAGGIGALSTLLASNFNMKHLKDLKIELTIDDYPFSPVSIYYYVTPVKNSSNIAKSLLKMCQDDFNTLNNICKNNVSINVDVQLPYDELIKLKELLDIGILSQEEFDKKKKELLNL